MDKIHLKMNQADALKKLLTELKPDPNNKTNGMYYTNLQSALYTCENVLSSVKNLYSAISNAMENVVNREYGDSVITLETTPEELKNVIQKIKDIEDSLARAVIHFDSATTKSKLKWLITPEDLSKELQLFDELYAQLYFEINDNNDIYLILSEADDDGNQPTLKETLIANGEEADLNEIIDLINELLDKRKS